MSHSSRVMICTFLQGDNHIRSLVLFMSQCDYIRTVCALDVARSLCTWHLSIRFSACAEASLHRCRFGYTLVAICVGAAFIVCGVDLNVDSDDSISTESNSVTTPGWQQCLSVCLLLITSSLINILNFRNCNCLNVSLSYTQ